MLRSTIWRGNLEAGAEAVQIFDTWAGVLPPTGFRALVHAADQTSDRELRAKRPGAKVIGFPRGAGNNLPRYVDETGVDAVGLGLDDRPRFRARANPERGCRCRAMSIRWSCAPAAPRSTARSMPSWRRFPAGPFIFNLGHGILPDTPIAHVEQMLKRVREIEPACTSSLKALHIIAVIAWMAGMLYLPRLFVYHCDAEPGSEQSETFKVMERRLLKAIINPAMIATWLLGAVARLETARWLAAPWFCTQSSRWCWRCPACTAFWSAWSSISPPTGTGTAQKFYRIINEIPTVLMIAHRDSGDGQAVLSRSARSRTKPPPPLAKKRVSRLC